MTPEYTGWTTETSSILPWIVLLPAIGAFINGIFGSKLTKRQVTAIAVGLPAASFVLSALLFFRLLGMDASEDQHVALVSELWTWLESDTLTIQVAFQIDQLSSVMLLVVTGVGGLIHVFSIGYMWDDAAYWRYFAYLNLFMFSMLTLILGKNLLMLFVGWEGVGLCSYLLIGFWYTDMDKAIAGKKAFIVNRIGDFAFLIGMFLLLFYAQGDLDFESLPNVFLSETGSLNPTLNMDPGTLSQREMTITLIGLLFFVGATGKSAQIPLYTWLPDAMAGPTPVSALIHAATMVTAGVYMMCRLNFIYALADIASLIVAAVGAITALYAATIALVQYDIKKVLAYSTVSQLGYMVFAAGLGAYTAAIFHLVTHAFFKACLFLGSGSVIHGLHHEQDIRKMGGLKKKFPVTRWTFLISCLAIAGIIPFAGFFSKDEILFNAFTTSPAGTHVWWLQFVLFGIGMLAAFGTAFYMFRLYFLTFEGDYRGDPHVLEHAHEVKVMNWPLIILGVLAAIGGFLGLPHFTHAHALHDWLEPVYANGAQFFHYSHDVAIEIGLMGASLAVAACGIFIAYKMYKRPSAELPTAPVDAWWFKLLTNKYYVDEFYNIVVVVPLKATAGLCYRFFDKVIIDGWLHTIRWIVRQLGRGLNWFQNGDVQAYVTAVVVGIAVLFAFVV